MFSFFKKKTGDIPPEQDNSESSLADSSLTPHESSEVSPGNIDASSGIAKQDTEKKQSWLSRLKSGLAKTSANLNIFGGTTIDEELFEELETALLVSDVGMPATEYLLDELRRNTGINTSRFHNRITQYNRSGSNNSSFSDYSMIHNDCSHAD